MTTQSRHLYRLLPLFDPLLCRPALVVEAHYRPARCLQVGDDESDSGEQLSKVELHFRHDPSRCLPARGLVEEALVPYHGLVAWPSHRARQQLRDVALQAVIRRYANGILHASLLQRLVNLRLGEGSIGTKHHLPAQFLLALDLRQKHFIPVLGAMYVAGSQLRSQTVSLPIEQEQRVI